MANGIAVEITPENVSAFVSTHHERLGIQDKKIDRIETEMRTGFKVVNENLYDIKDNVNSSNTALEKRFVELIDKIKTSCSALPHVPAPPKGLARFFDAIKVLSPGQMLTIAIIIIGILSSLAGTKYGELLELRRFAQKTNISVNLK